MSIITMIGSRKFIDVFREKYVRLSLIGDIVFIPAIFEIENVDELTKTEHEILDELHQEKMLMSDFVYVINPNGYIGKDTMKELIFAYHNNIDVKYLYYG